MDMTQEQKGAWIVHHAQKLSKIQEIPGYDEIKSAGKAGMLLSSMSASAQHTITYDKVKTLAKYSGISTLEIKPLLDILKRQELIDFPHDYNVVNILGITAYSVLKHTSEIFDSENPSDSQYAALALAEESSLLPQHEKKISQFLSDTFKISNKQVSNLLIDAKEFGFVDAEKVGSENLFFNGHLFRRETVKKTQAVLDALTDSESHKLSELNEILEKEGCVTADRAQNILGDDLYPKIIGIALFDVSFISNEHGRIGFLTKPSAFQKYGESSSIIDDTFDLAKIFISALKYGMTQSSSSRGQIRMLPALLKKLINGQSVGPVTAISQDYQILEQKGVVHVFHGQNQENGRKGYMMRLLKREVGEIALSVLTKGSASENFLLPNDMSNKPISKFHTPEEYRCIVRKETVSINQGATRELLLSLRTGEL